MQRCVQSARDSGVFTPFHVLANEPIDDCECYDATDAPMDDTVRPLICLKAAIARLPLDYYIWIPPNTKFQRLPREPLQALGSAPLHVPLLVASPSDKTGATSKQSLLLLMTRLGIPGRPYWGTAAFWIIQREAVDIVTTTAIQFWHKAKEVTPDPPLDAVLAYTMQLFCGNPHRHVWQQRPDLWQAHEENHARRQHSSPPPALTTASATD